MSDQHSKNGPEETGFNRTTEFGEPLWLDTLKTIGVALASLAVVIAVGGVLAIAIIAPWGRASFDCSIYCVLEEYYESWFTDEKPS